MTRKTRTNRTSRSIVVDTSVAKACGRGKIDANSPAPECTRALAVIREQEGVAVAMNPFLKGEWDQHAGSFAKRWLSAMIAQKRFTHYADPWPGAQELEAAAAAHLPPKKCSAVIKDAPIVGLAMVSDRRVISLDDAQAALLGRLVAEAPALRSLESLHWANPTDDAAQAWLESGAGECSRLCIAAASLETTGSPQRGRAKGRRRG